MIISKKKFEQIIAEKGLSGNDLDKMGINSPTRNRACKTGIKPITVNKIASALGCEVADLIDTE